MALYRSPDYQFESIGLSVQEKKFNIDFQDGGQLGLPIRTILTFLIFRSPQCFLPVSSQLAFWFRRMSEKKIFKMAAVLDFRLEQF